MSQNLMISRQQNEPLVFVEVNRVHPENKAYCISNACKNDTSCLSIVPLLYRYFLARHSYCARLSFVLIFPLALKQTECDLGKKLMSTN